MESQRGKKGLTRKEFLSYSTGCLLALGLPSFFKNISITQPFKQTFRVKPIAGLTYKPSFLAFCQKAKFTSPQQAIAAVKNCKIPFEICYGT